jgi:transcriptional adapter 2-alpha
MAFPLFTPGWTAEEELLLLEGLTLYSFGNWPDIADHVVSCGD